jgi:hypothetical protein
MKFEMEIGWVGDEKITIEAHNFEKIQIIYEFIELQQKDGWGVDNETVDCDDSEEEL